MYELLVKLMLIVALGQFGLSLFDVQNCQDQKCLRTIERRSLDVLNIDWKPISVFPEEARRFR